MKKGNEAKVVASDSSKRCGAAEQTKENPDQRLQDSLPCPLRKTNNKYSSFGRSFREKACQKCKR